MIDTVSTNGVSLRMPHRVGGRGCFFHLLTRTQEINIINEDSSAAVPKDMVALKAIEEAISMSERNDTMTRLTQRAFRGTVNVVLTCPT